MQGFFTLDVQQIRCFTHGKLCSMVCTFKGCTSKTICTECILTHPKNHLSKVQPLKDFDAQSNQVPMMIAKDLTQIRQRMSMLLNHIVQSREGRKSEVKRTLQRQLESIKAQIDAFAKDTMQEIDAFYGKPHGLVSEVLETCEKHIDALSPYLNQQVSHQDSKRFDFLLDYQEKLLTIILPKLAEQADQTGTSVMGKELEITADHFVDVMHTYIGKGLTTQTLLAVTSQAQPFKGVMDSLDTFKSKKVQEIYLPKLESRGIQYYKDQLTPYLHSQKALDYGEYRVPQSSDFNPQARVGSSQSQKVLPKHREAVPFEIYSGYQKHLNTVLPGHDDIITCLCIVSLSKLASGCGDGQIKMWDIDSQMCVGKLLGHIGEVWDLVPITDQTDGSVTELASCGRDRTIKVWSCMRMTCDYSFAGHLDVIRCLVYLPDQGQLASGGADYKIKLWSLSTQKQIFSIDDAHTKMVRALEYVPKKQLILSGSGDGLLKVWSLHKGYLRDELSHGAEIVTIKHLFDEFLGLQATVVATGGADHRIIVWNLDKGVPIKTLTGHHDSVLCLDITKQTLLSGGADKTIRIWDLVEGKLLKSIKAHNDKITVIKVHEERQLVVTAGWDKIIRVVSLEYLLQKEKSTIPK